MFPYLVGYWTRWYFLGLIHQEDFANEIVPGIWVGRRALPDKLPENISLIVNFAAEISEHDIRPRVKLSQVQKNLLNRVIPSIKSDLKSAN